MIKQIKDLYSKLRMVLAYTGVWYYYKQYNFTMKLISRTNEFWRSFSKMIKKHIKNNNRLKK
ncbi:hypothetical protein P9274_23990 [Schinkia azotoformans]|uniref:hypothetical protein n=1 Tax=Schinkia azotoformans TaxID=1454 RepID=UPI002E1D242F|nr:hypothetical protein [Schinkia azotoformans]